MGHARCQEGNRCEERTCASFGIDSTPLAMGDSSPPQTLGRVTSAAFLDCATMAGRIDLSTTQARSASREVPHIPMLCRRNSLQDKFRTDISDTPASWRGRSFLEANRSGAWKQSVRASVYTRPHCQLQDRSTLSRPLPIRPNAGSPNQDTGDRGATRAPASVRPGSHAPAPARPVPALDHRACSFASR